MSMRASVGAVGILACLLLVGCQTPPQLFGVERLQWDKLNAQQKQAAVEHYRVGHERSVRIMGPHDL